MVVSAQGPTRVIDLDDVELSGMRWTDDVGFDRLYTEFEPRVRGLVRRLLGSDDLTDDVVQETFLRGFNAGLHDEYRRPHPEHSPWPWLAAVARNLCLDHLRRRQILSFKPLEDAPITAGAAVDDPEAQVVGLSNRDGIVEVLESVSARHRRVLVLKHVEGLTYRDIAAREGLTVDALKSVLARARRSFRENYESAEATRGFGVVLGPLVLLSRRLRALRQRAIGGIDQAITNAFAAAPLAAQAVATTVVVGLAALAGPATTALLGSDSAGTVQTPALETAASSSDAPGPVPVEAHVDVEVHVATDPSPSAHVDADADAEVAVTPPGDPEPSPVEPPPVPDEVSVNSDDVVPVSDPPMHAGSGTSVEQGDDTFWVRQADEIDMGLPTGPASGGASVGGECPEPEKRGTAMSVLCPTLVGEPDSPTG